MLKDVVVFIFYKKRYFEKKLARRKKTCKLTATIRITYVLVYIFV